MNINYEIAEALTKAEEYLDKARELMRLRDYSDNQKNLITDNDRWNLRERMIFGVDYNPENYGKHGSYTKHFEGMTISTAEKLIELNFLDPEETQNDSPTVKEFINFAKDHLDENFTFHGYVVGPEREDCRISFEGIESAKNTIIDRKTILDFVGMFLQEYPADDTEVGDDRLYCWYD